MSEDKKADATVCCTACGIAEIDDIKLKDCDGCDLVKYCSDECRENHASSHEEACKKRAAELRDELLFKQPESTHMGDCPICMIPLSIDIEKSINYECCSKVVCRGCVTTMLLNDPNLSIEIPCPFCRSVTITKEEVDKQRRKRIEANDPAALCHEGKKHYNKGYYSRAFEYLSKAAELGDVRAHYHVAMMYRLGRGVEEDEEKVKYHFEEAAIGGHPLARHNLGINEYSNNNLERAVKHCIIAATQGYDASMKTLMDRFREGNVSKEDLAATLRAHKAAVDATKSPERELEEKISNLSG